MYSVITGTPRHCETSEFETHQLYSAMLRHPVFLTFVWIFVV